MSSIAQYLQTFVEGQESETMRAKPETADKEA